MGTAELRKRLAQKIVADEFDTTERLLLLLGRMSKGVCSGCAGAKSRFTAVFPDTRLCLGCTAERTEGALGAIRRTATESIDRVPDAELTRRFGKL